MRTSLGIGSSEFVENYHVLVRCRKHFLKKNDLFHVFGCDFENDSSQKHFVIWFLRKIINISKKWW